MTNGCSPRRARQDRRFEGAQISCGQRATAGLSNVRIDRQTLALRFRVIGSELWSDEEGFAAATKRTGVTGVCGSGIIEVVGEMYLAGVIDAEGVIQGDNAKTSPHVVADGRTFAYVISAGPGPVLMITQNDVRAIQLAKAALRAGIDLLVERAVERHGASPDLADIRLAGAFGAHIDPLYAMVLGLVPDCALAGVRSVGNAAGTGAARALLSAEQRGEIERVVDRVEKIETATEPRFQDLFVAAMSFPHRQAPTENLAQYVALPPRSQAPSSTGQRRRRRPVRPD
ncbi:MAG: ATP-binding protein [Acidimicrobiales bacterium]